SSIPAPAAPPSPSRAPPGATGSRGRGGGTSGGGATRRPAQAKGGGGGGAALRLPIEEIGPSGDVDTVHFAVRLFRRGPAHRWQRTVCERVTAAATEYVALPIRHHGYADVALRYDKLDR